MSCFTDIENKPDDWLVLDPLTIQKPIPKTGCDTNLLVLNYLSEFKTDALKLKVKDNLGLYVDNILSKNSNNPISNKVVYDEFNKLKSQVRLNTIDWSDDSDINDYVEEGTYNIKGKKTRQDDNLPIVNTGDINAQLTVIVTKSDNNIVITLVLNLNNNAGGEGNVYIRSYQNGEWKAWGKLQTNIEVGQVNTLDNLTDNGIYSGVFTDGTPTSVGAFYDTFVLIVINNYAVSIPTGNPQSISQLKYSLGLDGSISVASRKRDQYGYWDNWSSLDEKSLVEEEKARAEQAEQTLGNRISAEVDRAKEAEKTIDDKLNDEIKKSVAADQGLLSSIDEEARRATKAEDAIKSRAVDADSLNVAQEIDGVRIDFATLDDGAHSGDITIPVATTTTTGVMSAQDKVSLDSIPNEIEKIKDGDTIVGQAREIHSRNGKTVTDSFLARTTAGSGTIGDGVASLKSVGGNIVKNLVPPINSNGWKLHGPSGNLTFNNGIAFFGGVGSYTGIRTIDEYKTLSGHKYYLMAYIYADSDYLVFVNIGGSTVGNGTVSNKWSLSSFIFDKELNGDVRFLPNVASKSYYITKPRLIDLTEMFGAGKEPSKEECDRLFGTMDALPQGLSIANPTEFKSTGFNQFNPDNVLEGKAIVDNAIVSGDKKIAVIPCLPCKVGIGENNGYCIHGDFGEDIKVYLTPLNPMEVDGELYMHELTKDATTDTYVPLIKGYMLVEVPTTANLCAHFLWSEDKCERDSYEPYFESKVELPVIPQMSEWGLAGIQSSGTLVCDEIDFERGVYVKRIYKKVFNGSERWIQSGSQFYTSGVKPINKGSNQLFNWNGYFKSSSNKTGSIVLNNEFTASTLYIVPLESIGITDVATWKAYLANNPFEIYYELATPEEYPLTKVDNNYISSDYGVEQFDSVVPCNANNLYYMRSLAGETRNFLDRMYNNTAKADAKEVADYITSGIEGNKELATNAPNLALRALFIAAGAEYNDTDQIIYKTAPWETEEKWVKNADGTYTYSEVPATVDHLPKHYYLNGLGDITEEEMMNIYIETFQTTKQNEWINSFRGQKLRTNLFPQFFYSAQVVKKIDAALYSTDIDVVRTCFTDSLDTTLEQGFLLNSCSVKYIYGVWNVSNFTAIQSYASNNPNLRHVKIKGLKQSTIIFNKAMHIYKRSVLYSIQEAAPTTNITITLHPDAYARIANQPDILEALAAQPLITLVSA